MTERERLVLLLTADAVIAGALNPCAKVEVEALRKARHALDDEAMVDASKTQAAAVAEDLRTLSEEIDRLLAEIRKPMPKSPFVGPMFAPLKPESDAATLGRARDALDAGGAAELRPPEEHRGKRLHWLHKTNDIDPTYAQYLPADGLGPELWDLLYDRGSNCFTPGQMALHGYRYLCPVKWPEPCNDAELVHQSDTADSLQGPLLNSLGSIIAIVETTHHGEERAFTALSRIETLARNARRWLEQDEGQST